MSQANGIVLLHHDQGDVTAGDEVEVIPFEGLTCAAADLKQTRQA